MTHEESADEGRRSAEAVLIRRGIAEWDGGFLGWARAEAGHREESGFFLALFTQPMTWLQNYDPLGNRVLSTPMAMLPILVLLGSIAWLRVRNHLAALGGLCVAFGVAALAYRMPLSAVTAATLYGAAFGLFPIGWIILNLTFLYQLTVRRGWFEVLRRFGPGHGLLHPDPPERQG